MAPFGIKLRWECFIVLGLDFGFPGLAAEEILETWSWLQSRQKAGSSRVKVHVRAFIHTGTSHTDTYVHRLFPRRGWGVEWRAHSLLIPSPSTLLSPSRPLVFAKLLHFQKRVLTSSGLSYHWIRVGVQVNPFYIVKPVPL